MNNIGTASQLVAVLVGGTSLVCFQSIERGWYFTRKNGESLTIYVTPDRFLKVTTIKEGDIHNEYIRADRVDTISKLAHELELLGIKFDVLRAQQSLLKYHSDLIASSIQEL